MVFASKLLHQTCIFAAVCHAALHTSAADMPGSGWDCSVPTGYSINELKEVQYRNCKKVGDTMKDFAQAKNGSVASSMQVGVWEQRAIEADRLCTLSQKLLVQGKYHQAAEQAATAWGAVVKSGAECCVLVGTPFCEARPWSPWAASKVGVLLVVCALVAAWSMLVALRQPTAPKEPMPLAEQQVAPGLRSIAVANQIPKSTPTANLQPDLEAMWVRASCLRVLPGASKFARCSASLFASLQEAFDFQTDNVQNQFEHLMSMWRSHCAMVADRAIEEQMTAKEEHLLGEALADCHADLLEGFSLWRSQLSSYESSSAVQRSCSVGPRIGDAGWERVHESACGPGATAEAAEALSTQLAEIATYLLVWGESGNLRFMPEVVYFITDLALTADNGHLYGGADSADVQESSSNFLARVIRPVYNVIFDEWYDAVDVDDKGKDKKILHDGVQAFLPADTANYDDWNELFADPKRLSESLVLNDGTRLCALPHGQRFAALTSVDWRTSLQAARTKTHREIHSLWGVFAATHRVWLLQSVMFLVTVCVIAEDPPNSKQPELTPWLVDMGRYATVALTVPIHGLLYKVALWQVTGRAFRWRCGSCLRNMWNLILMLPIASYIMLLSLKDQEDVEPTALTVCLIIHYGTASMGLCYLLLMPSEDDKLWSLTPVPFFSRLVRYLFWILVLAVKYTTGVSAINATYQAVSSLSIAREGYETPRDLGNIFYSITSANQIMQWFNLWGVSFMFYLADTQLWFMICSSFFGMAIVFIQRGLRVSSVLSFMFEDSLAKIPERFSKKVLLYSSRTDELKTKSRGKPLSPGFPAIWDRIVQYMRYEDVIDHESMGNLSFATKERESVSWEGLQRPLELADRRVKNPPASALMCRSGCGRPVQPGLLCGKPHTTCCRVCALHPGLHKHDSSCCKATESGELEARAAPALTARVSTVNLKLPGIFRGKNSCEKLLSTYGCIPDQNCPSNANVQWRLAALARGLGLPLPRPFRAPYIPGLTVLIPHYGEAIRMHKDDLYHECVDHMKADGTLIDFIKYRWNDEFQAFTSRQQATAASGKQSWPLETGGQWADYNDDQWTKLAGWSSMRMQTLWRTVGGMCLYHPALQCHYEAQAEQRPKLSSRLAHPSVWDPNDCFTCLVSLQMYKFFEPQQLADINAMFQKFPGCLKAAFIDSESKGASADADFVHPRQRRRYFSCLIDKDCEQLDDGRRKPRFRIELPGYPILGDGKGDNQNHAIPFMRGTFAQCIDANQGAYFEQMLLLPCVLGEFRTSKRGDGNGKRIVGFPEHITSDMGSVGDMAASAETAFGTILQRTFAVLGARMHYGHPDVMNKHYMMQQGGVSKATKTLNLSEDIFAGMDFTLRGEGRRIRHCEYFNLAKGRDLGFNTVLGFFSKLASGTGEQILTRQMFRLGQVLQLPEFLTFYFAHVGYYFNQVFISWSLPLLVHVWLAVIVSDCEGSFDHFQHCNSEPARSPVADVMAKTWETRFSNLLFLFLAATSLPLLAELWLERSLKMAIVRLLKQVFTLSPLLFIFQAKVICAYVVNELRFGGATYVSTGRGLPTERRPFLGEVAAKGIRLKKVGGLYLDYATVAYYDGMTLLGGAVAVAAFNMELKLLWLWISLGFVITSWLFAPFLYNPHQFLLRCFCDDLWSWLAFFGEAGGKNWTEWYEKTQLKLMSGRRFNFDSMMIVTCFILLTWWELVVSKAEALAAIYTESESISNLKVFAILPPLGASLLFCMLTSVCSMCVACVQKCFGTDKTPAPADVECPAPATHDDAQPRERLRRCPLIFLALGCILLDVGEATYGLYDFHQAGWHKAFIAGCVLKYLWLLTCVSVGEAVLRLQCFRRIRHCVMPLECWVYAHRMARDLLTSTFILFAMTPLVLLNSINLKACPGFSIHHLLVYRDPGRPASENLTLSTGRKGTLSRWGFTSWKSEVLGSEFSRTFKSKSKVFGSDMERSSLSANSLDRSEFTVCDSLQSMTSQIGDMDMETGSQAERMAWYSYWYAGALAAQEETPEPSKMPVASSSQPSLQTPESKALQTPDAPDMAVSDFADVIDYTV